MDFSTKYYVGYSSDNVIRYKSSSGGVGTALIKYLFSLPEWGTAMTFVFNKQMCMYEPKLIYSFDDYNICGSIYQDTNTIQFIKDSINKIRGGVVVTCMPCQVRAIRSILNAHYIKSFIISFCCSGQTTIDGTWLYYKLLGIKKEDVSKMQYRGNGWPSGIQIHMKDGRFEYHNNWTYPWTLVHSSLLFRPKRCLLCTYKTVPDSDVNLADPWLKEYEEHDTIGNSIIICNSEQSINVLDKMQCQGKISCTEVDEKTYYLSQKGTIEAKEHIGNEIRYYNLIAKLMSNKIYRLFATYNIQTLKLHLKLLSKIRKLFS